VLKAEQVSWGYSVKELWLRGRLWEIFGFSGADFTGLELAIEYSRVSKIHKRSPEEWQYIQNAFAILNAPLTRQFYEGCRMLAERIKHEIGNSAFEQAEAKIWAELWSWVSQRWQPPPDELVRALIASYPAKRVAPSHKKETPILSVQTKEIEFGNITPGAHSSRGFIIRNSGGGVLTGTLTTTELWLRVWPKDLNFQRHQVIEATVDTTELPVGHGWTAYIDVLTNGGRTQISVRLATVSVELPAHQSTTENSH
jgi:hypothetical protein